jgi:AraC-like DNA-binding protein
MSRNHKEVPMGMVDARRMLRQGPRAWHIVGQGLEVSNHEVRGPQAPFKLLLQVRGEAALTLSRQRLSLQAGQFTLIDGQSDVRVQSHGPLEQWLVTLPRQGVLARHRGIERQVGRVFDDSPEAVLVASFVKTLGAQTERLHEAARAWSITALIGLLGGLDHAHAQTAAHAESALLARARAWVDLELADVDAPALAQRLRVSRRHLDKVFEKQGLSASRYIWLRRLTHAAAELRAQPDKPVVEIAYGVGFKDPSHFTRAFVQLHGMTPTVWRATDAGDPP